MGRKVRDLTGQRFGRLVALERAPNAPGDPRARWLCQCDCGNKSLHNSRHLVSLSAQSCGCRQIDLTVKRSFKHGLSKTPEYAIWNSMMGRCHNEENTAYQDYGARGIQVCARWHDFENFLEDMGKRPSKRLTIERKNNDEGYCKDNCFWAIRSQQARNKRNNVHVSAFGRKMVLADLNDMFNVVPYKRAHKRIQRGWCATCATSIPIQGGKCTHR